MRPVGILAITGLVALVIALVTGSTPLAVVVIGLAAAGIVLLIRDWHEDRGRADAAAGPVEDGAARGLSPDEFSPDISTDPDGPSSDARAD